MQKGKFSNFSIQTFIHLFIHSSSVTVLSLLLLYRSRTYPGNTGRKEYTLDGMLVHYRTPCTHTFTFTFTPICNFSIANPPGMFLGGGKNPENSEETDADNGTACNTQAGPVRWQCYPLHHHTFQKPFSTYANS